MAVAFSDYLYSGDVNVASYTFAGLDFGVPDADRWIVAAIYVSHNGSRSLNAVTIGGVSAAFLYGAPTLTAGEARLEFWAANVPTGSSGGVSISAVPADSGGFYNAACATYVCSGEPTLVDADFEGGTNSTTLTTSVDVPDGGAVIAVASNNFTGPLSSWTGAGGDSTDETNRIYYASADALTAETARTVSVTFGQTFNINLALATVSLSIAGGAEPITIEVPAATATLGSLDTGVAGGASVSIPTVAGSITGGMPAVASGTRVTAPAGSLQIAASAPSVAGGGDPVASRNRGRRWPCTRCGVRCVGLGTGGRHRASFRRAFDPHQRRDQCAGCHNLDSWFRSIRFHWRITCF